MIYVSKCCLNIHFNVCHSSILHRYSYCHSIYWYSWICIHWFKHVYLYIVNCWISIVVCWHCDMSILHLSSSHFVILPCFAFYMSLAHWWFRTCCTSIPPTRNVMFLRYDSYQHWELGHADFPASWLCNAGLDNSTLVTSIMLCLIMILEAQRASRSDRLVKTNK